MARIPFTLRVDPEERLALENLSKVEGRPVNQLLNEAIKLYLRQRGAKERALETHLAGLRAYRSKDPVYGRAIEAFVNAEASAEDPLEGSLVGGQFVDGKFEPAGPVQTKIRDLLGA